MGLPSLPFWRCLPYNMNTECQGRWGIFFLTVVVKMLQGDAFDSLLGCHRET